MQRDQNCVADCPAPSASLLTLVSNMPFKNLNIIESETYVYSLMLLK